jgi:hypothetical protein
MARDTQWVGRYCASGTNFNTQARAAFALPIGNVFYVDLSGGSDGNTGESWARSMLTINAAYDKCVNDGNDYVIVRGFKTETATSIITTADVQQCHTIGHAGILTPYFPEKGSLYRSGAADAPHTRITGEFNEWAGFAMNAVQGAGSESSSVTKGALELGSTAGSGAASAGNKAYVHNCYFPDWNSATTVTGITITGAHYAHLRDIVVDSIYGNIDSGIYMTGSSGANPAWGVMENMYFRGGTGGALATGINMNAGASMQSFKVLGVQHTRGTNVVNFASDNNNYSFFDDIVGDMTAANIFAASSTVDARDTLWSVMASVAGGNVYGRDAIFPDT